MVQRRRSVLLVGLRKKYTEDAKLQQRKCWRIEFKKTTASSEAGGIDNTVAEEAIVGILVLNRPHNQRH